MSSANAAKPHADAPSPRLGDARQSSPPRSGSCRHRSSSPPRGILARKAFDLGSELTGGHKVGSVTGAKTSSGGPHRSDTIQRSFPHADPHPVLPPLIPRGGRSTPSGASTPVIITGANYWRFWRRSVPASRCLIPRFDGAILSLEWKEAPWDKFVTGAPRTVTRQAVSIANLPRGTGPAGLRSRTP